MARLNTSQWFFLVYLLFKALVGAKISAVSEPHEQLLEAAIQHLHDLRERGVRHVAVSAETLAELGRSRVGATRTPVAVVAPPPSTPPPPRQPAPPASEIAKAIPEMEKRATQPGGPIGMAAEPTPASQGAPLNPQEKAAAFAELRRGVLACMKCPNLAAARKTVVFGVGDINTRILFVGEAPGADEDEQGEPFVGKAGQLLTKIIQAMGLTRDSVYIANILKCRPDTPGQSAGNRKPTPEEMKTCLPYLERQIDLIRPQVIVALGATAVEGLLGKPVFITKLRGQWQTYRGIPLMPTYHPAYLLRNQAKSEKRRVWEDMMQAMERVALPISEKQRGFFL